MNSYPTRQNHILNLILTSAPEFISNLSCIPPATLSIFTDHHLLFFDLLMRVGSKVCDNRNVFEFEHADWNGLHKTLRQHDLAPCETTDIDTDWAKWKDLFLCAAAKHITQKLFKMCNTPPCIDGKVKHLLIKKHTHIDEWPNGKCPPTGKSIENCDEMRSTLSTKNELEFFKSLPTLLLSNSKSRFWLVFNP